MDATPFPANTVAPPAVAGPDLWLAVDPFGEAVLTALRPTVAAMPAAGTCRLLSVTQLTAPAGRQDGQVPPLVASALASLRELLAAHAYRRAVGAVVPHIWVPYDLADPAAVLPATLACLLGELTANAIPCQLFCLVRWMTQDADAERRQAARQAVAALIDDLIGPNQPGHGRTVVFVATDRDARGLVYSAADCTEAVVRFAELMLLGNVMRAAAGPIANVTTPFPLRGDEPWRDLATFAAIGIKVGEYPARQLLAAHQRRQLGQIVPALRMEPGLEWRLQIPPFGPIKPETSVPAHPLPLPAWTPDLRQPVTSEFDRAVATVDRWHDTAETWQHDRLVQYREDARLLPAATARKAADFRQALDTNIAQMLGDAGQPGLFPLIDRGLGRAIDELHVWLTELPTPQPLDLSDEGVPELPPLSEVEGKITQRMAGALERRINLPLVCAIAAISATIGWLLIAFGIMHVDQGLLAVLAGPLSRWSWVPGDGRRLFRQLHRAAALDGLRVWVWSGLAVGAFVGVTLWLIMKRARRNLDRAFAPYVRRAARWRKTVASRLDTSLQEIANQHYRTELEQLISDLTVRRQRLAQLDQAMDQPPGSPPSTASRILTTIAPRALPADPQLTAELVREAIARVRAALPPDLHGVTAADLAERLSTAADELSGWSPPSLVRDGQCLTGMLPALVPSDHDVQALVMAGGDRTSVAATLTVAGVPAVLQRLAADTCPRCHVVAVGADNTIYTVIIQYRLTAYDLFRDAVATPATVPGGVT